MNIFSICLSIFTARIIDVSIGVIRTIVMVKGKSVESAILAFFEVLIWFLVAREALNSNINSILVALSYAGGYATGTYIGSLLSKKFIKGTITIQAVTSKATKTNLEKLRKSGYALSVIEVKSDYDGKKKDMLVFEVSNKDVKELTKLIRAIDPLSFITANETKFIQNGFIK